MSKSQESYNKSNIRKDSKQPYSEKDLLNPPEDKFHFVQIILLFLGLSYALPGTFFTTASQYWMYKFRDPSSNSTDANDRTILQANFISVHAMVSTISSVMTAFVNVFIGHKLPAKIRILYSLVGIVVIFGLQAVFVRINTDDWQIGFYCVTMATMALLSCIQSIGSIGNLSLISLFPKNYVNIYLIGDATASVIASLMRILSIAISPSDDVSALIYFLTGTVMMATTGVMFYFVTKTEYFKFQTRNSVANTKRKIPSLFEVAAILKTNHLWLLLCCFMSTCFTAHPALTSLVVSENYSSQTVWAVQYFPVVVTYFLASFVTIFAKMLSAKVHKFFNPWTLFMASMGKSAIFTALVLFCNAKPRKHLPVLFPHDWQYVIIIFFNSLVAGVILNIPYLKIVRAMPQEKLELALMVTGLTVGVFGAISSPLRVVAVSFL